jgi:CheY-like chemotaxis protein
MPRLTTPSYIPGIVLTEERPSGQAVAARTVDDRYNIQPNDRVLLIAEDDLDFGAFVCEIARAQGFKCLLAPDGHSALALIVEFQPDAVVLDLGLPHLDGWRLLDRLKSDLGTRHIPVAVVSANDEAQRGLKMGSLRFCTKPISREQIDKVVADLRGYVERSTRQVLVLEDDPAQQMSIAELIGNPKVQVTAAGDAENALALLAQRPFDCLILDLRLPGSISGNQLLEEIQRQPVYRDLATVVYTGKVLSSEEESRLNQLARSIVLKDVRSPERLLDQTTLRLHTHIADLSQHQLELLKALHSDDGLLPDRNVLLVDDDMRNVFAMTSVLERYGMTVLPAESWILIQKSRSY